MSNSPFRTHASPLMASVPEAQLDPQDRQVYTELFRMADKSQRGVVLKDEAMAFFVKADIPTHILNDIWDAADRDGKGFLTDKEFFIALKLIACAQHGILPASPVISTSAPLPQFSGINLKPELPGNKPTPMNRSVTTPVMSSPSTSSSAGNSISPEDRANYIKLFQSLGPVDGLLSGNTAKEVFTQSSLPPNMLAHIWNLAATRKSNTLNQTEFIIAMHYISSAKSGKPLPPSLPASIYAAAATGRALVAQASPRLASTPTGPMRSQTLPPSTEFTQAASQPFRVNEAEIGPEEAAQYRAIFEQLDVERRGYVTGTETVPFFERSQLSSNDLANIWEVADKGAKGKLTQQEFILAMHLISRRKAALAAQNTLQTRSPAIPQATVPTLSPSQRMMSPIISQHQVQRAELESSLETVRSEKLAQINQEQQIRSQYEAEARAIRELQQTLAREREELEKWKRSVKEAEDELARAKQTKETLQQELQVTRQETKHFKQRAEQTQAEVSQIQAQSTPSSTLASVPPAQAPSDLFSLSSETPQLFSNTQSHTFTASPIGSPSSGITTGTPAATSPLNSNQLDPVAAWRENRQQPQQMSINLMKQEAEAKQAARSSPQVDISEIEAKFPDLTTMEHNFSSQLNTLPSQTPSQTTPAAPFSSTPKLAASTPVATPPAAHAAQATSPPRTQPSLTFSPVQAKSVAKYGFDLSAFEANESSEPQPARHQPTGSSLKDDLQSLFGTPTSTAQTAQTTQPAQAAPASRFDDIFNISSSTPDPSQQAKPKSFEDIFS